MPLDTKHYKLGAFVWGDNYSSVIDRRRFTIIDNQLDFLTTMVGDGVVFGWGIIDNGDGTVSISSGMGIIDKRVVQSFGKFDVSLSSNTIHYLYMKSKEGEVGGISGNSNMVSLVAINSISPEAPSGLQQETSISGYLARLSSYDDDFVNYINQLLDRRYTEGVPALVSYKEVAFSWTANEEFDFSHYKIIRVDGSNVDVMGTTTEVFYADTNLIHDHIYTYKVVAVDFSGNESASSETVISTDVDTRIPSPPLFVEVFPSDSTLEVIWDHSPTGDVESYEIEIQPLDTSYNNNGSSTSITVDATSEVEFGSTYAIFENLENDVNYDVTVYAVPVGGVVYKSDGVTTRTLLQAMAGAGEVNSITAKFPISLFENVGIETTLEWEYVLDDPYLPLADKFLVTVIERGSRFSEVIEVLESSSQVGVSNIYNFEMKYIPYRIDGEIRYESIKEYTPYIFMIQTEDEYGNFSNGVRIRVNRTPISEALPSITDLSVSRKADNSLFLQWENPQEFYFNYNLITISIIDLASGDIDNTSVPGIPIVTDLRIDRAETYVIPSEQFNVDYRYDIIITPYDFFDEMGVAFSTSNQFLSESSVIRPPIPDNLQLRSGDTEMYLIWDKIDGGDQYIEFYKIYRASFNFYVRSSDFVNIATTPSSNGMFTDYTAVNGTVYTYFVTSVDIYGVESLNPADDGYMPPGLISGNPVADVSMSSPEGLVGITNSNEADVELSWDATSGDFDGYEILKSDENDYSFVIVDNIPSSQTTYVDSNALLKDGASYYYLVRKYKNEVDISVTSSSTLLNASVFIGKVTTSDGISNVVIDFSSVVNILNLEDPLMDKTNVALAIHHHTNDQGIDKRIELRSNIHVGEWTTNDYITYSTVQDIEGGNSYFLSVSGTLNEDYFVTNEVVDVARLAQAQAGESPILFEIDTENNKIVFNSALYSSQGSFSAPYSEAPTLSLEILGVSEVDGFLSPVNVGSMSATQFASGQLDMRQMPIIYHQGRQGERLIPLRLPMKTLDNFVYSLASTYDNGDRNNMGTAVTFYDIITISSDRLLAATSNGIWLSNNYGNDWEQNASFSSAVHRLYKSQADEYYAITNYAVYKNNGTSFKTWDLMSGLEFVKVIRDITEDNSGNLYVSTDLGVFRLNSEDVPYIKDSWEKLSIFGPRSSESYAILYDGGYFDSATTGRLLVSNELGLLQSTDEGKSWIYILELEANVKIRKFLIDSDYIFALSDVSLYREEIGTTIFDKVAELDVSESRDIEIFGSKIYIVTDEGAISSVSSNIYTDESIDFVSEFTSVNINNNTVIVTTINKIGIDLFVGTDKRIYVLNRGGDLWLQFEEKNTVIPTFYVDSILQKIGYYYNNGGEAQNISFDEIISHEKVVEVSNKYDMYFAEYGGWAQNKYTSKFIVYNNNYQFGESPDVIELDAAPFFNIVLPTYDDNNANKITADIYKAQVEFDLEQITAVTPFEGEDLVALIIDTYQDLELFLSQLYEEARVLIDDDGNITDFVLPKILTDLIIKRTSTSNLGEVIQVEEPVYTVINADRGTSYTTSVNIVNGMFVFDLPFDKYDNLTVDIHDVTVKNVGELGHREVEDAFEQIYSGPPSYLSQVQQANIVKMGIFGEKHWPGQQKLVSTPLQMETFVPIDDTWYDTLNSTINYEVQNENSGLSLSLLYPSSVIFSANTGNVLVGGRGGVLSIDSDNLNISVINFGSIDNQMVRSIYELNDNTFILTDESIFVSSDRGITWSEFDRSGLPNHLYSLGSINSNLIVGAEDGIYIKLSNSESISWEKVKDSLTPVEVIYSSNILFAIVGIEDKDDTTKIDKNIFLTANGLTYTDTGIGKDLDIINITRYGFTNTYVSTNQGLYSDNGSFNSLEPKLEEVDLGELLSDTVTTINDTVTNNSDKTVIGASSGSYGIVQQDVLSIKDFTSLESIHRVLFVNDDIWLFGQDVFKVPSLDYPIKLSTGAPI